MNNFTPAGGVAIEVLRLNRPSCVDYRLERSRLESRIDEYRKALADLHQNQPVVDWIARILTELEAEYRDCFQL